MLEDVVTVRYEAPYCQLSYVFHCSNDSDVTMKLMLIANRNGDDLFL